MKNLSSFALFEYRSEVSFRFGGKMPKTQQELDVINGYPEFQTMRDIIDCAFKGSPFQKNPSEIKFTLKKTGTVFLDAFPTGVPKGWYNQILAFHPFNLYTDGSLYYGTYPIKSSVQLNPLDWHVLIDFINVYIISKLMGWMAVDLFDGFVFEGKQMSDRTMDRLERVPRIKEILIEMAKKYNGKEKINQVIYDMSIKGERYITANVEAVEKCESYKWAKDIFGLRVTKTGDKRILELIRGYGSPYAIFDLLLGSNPVKSIALYFSPNGNIHVKSLNGLNKKIEESIRKIVINPHAALMFMNEFWKVENEMTTFVLDNFGSPISKEMLIEKFAPQIVSAYENEIENIINQENTPFPPHQRWEMAMNITGKVVWILKNPKIGPSSYDLKKASMENDASDMLAKVIAERGNLKTISLIQKSMPDVWKRIQDRMGDDKANTAADLGDLGF